MNNYYNYKESIIEPTYPNPWSNSKGFLAIPINLENSDIFEKQLLVGANEWFHSYIDEEKYPNLKNYNLTNLKTLEELFDSIWRKNHLSSDENKAVRNALDGGGNAQFQPYKGWRKSGFGIWSHIRGSKFIYTDVMPEVYKIYSKIYNGPIKIYSIPHLIFKPPLKKGGELDSHNDGGSWNDMYTRCLQCETLEKWVTNYGIQTLLHIKGARIKDGGQTTLLGPLDTHTYLIILQMIHPKTIHPDMQSPKDGWENQWFTSSGPKFYGWYNLNTLKIINRVVKMLKENVDPITENDKIWVSLLKKYSYYELISNRAKQSKYQKIQKIKMLPSENVDSSYLVAWPNGFIHGSEPTGLTPRLTLTIPYSSEENIEKTKRALKRLENLASGNMKEVLKDTNPYENGIVHQSTKTEVEIYPFFKDIYITKNDIDDVKKTFNI